MIKIIKLSALALVLGIPSIADARRPAPSPGDGLYASVVGYTDNSGQPQTITVIANSSYACGIQTSAVLNQYSQQSSWLAAPCTGPSGPTLP